MPKLCHCGKPLHYTNKAVKQFIEKMVVELGEHVQVDVGDRVYNVPRHYVALHGISTHQLPRLGFEFILKN